MRLFGTNENEAKDSPIPRSNEAKMPHCKIYRPMTELITVRARESVSTYGIPVAIGPRHRLRFLPTAPNNTMVLRVGNAWLVVMGKTHAQGRLARVAHLMRGPWFRCDSGKKRSPGVVIIR